MQLNIRQIQFSDPQFEHCLQIRMTVFVGEQNVPAEEERDEYDPVALHFLGLANDSAIGTARALLKDGDMTAKIGRVAVLQSARGLGIGAALIRHIETTVGATLFLLDAQTHALRFYERLGYEAYGDEFIEAGISHFHMRKRQEI